MDGIHNVQAPIPESSGEDTLQAFWSLWMFFSKKGPAGDSLSLKKTPSVQEGPRIFIGIRP
jgi:hypothetical protein